jgi:hypothetical protein
LRIGLDGQWTRIGLPYVGDGGLVVELTIVGYAPNDRWRRGWPEP